MTDYPAVLTSIRPGAQWSMNETYDSLVWLDDSPKPTKKTLDDAWPQVEYENAYAAVEDARRFQYQAETDGLYFHAMREDTPTLTAWMAAVDAIKASLPYPEAP